MREETRYKLAIQPLGKVLEAVRVPHQSQSIGPARLSGALVLLHKAVCSSRVSSVADATPRPRPRTGAPPTSPSTVTISSAVDAADETKTQTRNLVFVAELLHDRHITPRPPRVQRDRSLKHRQLQP